jgi:hypothetical protein
MARTSSTAVDSHVGKKYQDGVQQPVRHWASSSGLNCRALGSVSPDQKLWCSVSAAIQPSSQDDPFAHHCTVPQCRI